MLHIIPNRECIIRHIYESNIFYVNICITFCLSEFIFRTFYKPLYFSCKSNSIVGNGEIIPYIYISYLGKGRCQPDSILICRIKSLSFYVVRPIYDILSFQINIDLRTITLRCRPGNRHTKPGILDKIKIPDCL